MPIRFRCSYCNRRLAIATRKAGAQTTCPHCAATITVPTPEPVPAAEIEEKTEAMDFEMTELLREIGPAPAPAATAAPPTIAVTPELPKGHKPPPAAAPRPAPPARSVGPRPAPPPLPPVAPVEPSEPPLFLGDVDKLLGLEKKPAEEERPKPKPTSGMDALSLSDPGGAFMMSTTKAIVLAALVVLLMVIAFFAGMAVAGRK